jgi:hypothetical protein
MLKQILRKDADLHQDPNRHATHVDVMEELKLDCIDWLGESKYMHGLTNIPISRFSKHNANGLWEYSPLLCAADLLEGLVIVQRFVMLLWDNIPEPTLALHLHNVLVKKGYLKKEIGLYTNLEHLFQDSFFPDGIPTEGFLKALLARTAQGRNDRAFHSEAVTKDIHQIWNPDLNRFFKNKSDLMVYYHAEWVPEKIPDSAVRIPSMIYMMRLMRTERMIDPTTGEMRLEQTEIVKRAKAQGQTDSELLEAASIQLPNMDAEDEEFGAFAGGIAELKDYKTGPPTQSVPSFREEEGWTAPRTCSAGLASP